MTQTTETTTKTIRTDRYCYTTEKKLLGPKTKECTRKRAIDTALIMGLGKGGRPSALRRLGGILLSSGTISEPADSAKVAAAIRPTNAVQKAPEAHEEVMSGQSANPRDGRFCCYVVTKTDTETSYIITATTTVTLKCTPARSILPMCQ